MSTNSILEALREEIDFDWGEPFTVKMGDIRRLIKNHGFRQNFILYYLKKASLLFLIPKGDEVDNVIVAEFSYGITKSYYDKHVATARKIGLLEDAMMAMHQKGPIWGDFEIEYTMEMCRDTYNRLGYTFDESHKLYQQLERDGFMKVLKIPDDLLKDDEVVAMLTKIIPDDYYQKNKEKWL